MVLKRLLFSIFVFLFMCADTSAQQNATVTGTVKDPNGNPLFGATIGVIGRPIGVYTKDNGNFSLQVPANENLQLIISYQEFLT